METCANPGCSEPGTNRCAGCKTTPYCGPICQTAHWPTHKESCDGRLRKMGMDHLNKARGFHREINWTQLLRHSDLAATKLKQLKDRPLEAISEALEFKCIALDFLGRYREQLECAKEWYCLWNTKPTDMGAICAAFRLIQSCLQNKEYVDARLYASTLWGIINHKHDNKIPEDKRQEYIADGAYFLASATLSLAQNGGIPPEEQQKAGQESIALARRALEIHTELHGTESGEAARDMGVLAEALNYFNDDDDNEIFRLFEKSKAIHTRIYGGSSVCVAVCEKNLGDAYKNKATRARAVNDLDRALINLNLSRFHYCEVERILRITNRMDDAEKATQNIASVEQQLLCVEILRAAKASKAAVTTKG